MPGEAGRGPPAMGAWSSGAGGCSGAVGGGGGGAGAAAAGAAAGGGGMAGRGGGGGMGRRARSDRGWSRSGCSLALPLVTRRCGASLGVGEATRVEGAAGATGGGGWYAPGAGRRGRGARAGPALVTRGRGRGGCSRLGCTRRGGRGGLGLGLVDDRIAAETFGVGLAPDAIGLGVDDARRVAAHADAQRLAQVERLLVGEPELSTELVDPDLRCQSATSTPSSPRRTDLRSVYRSILARLSALRDTCSLVSNVESLTQLGDRSGLDRSP